MRGLGDLQVGIMVLCEEDEAPRATFSVAAMRERLATDRGVLRCDMKAFKLSFRRALEGLVRRRHLIWGDVKRSRVRRGPVQPVLPGLTRKQAREFRAFILEEMERPPEREEREEDVKGYLTDEPDEKDSIRVLRSIAMDSDDMGARLAAIRRLAMYLGADGPPEPPKEARWNVILVPPGDPDHVDTKPTEADAA